MVNKELLDALRYKSEGTDLDFKSEQYCFAGGTEHQKSEMLKDILAMANAWREGTGYILLGFKDKRPHLAEVVGISDSNDDSRLQQFVNMKVTPKLTFRYEEHLYEGKTVGVIAIPKQKRPFFIAHPYGKLKGKIAYVRRGSSTEEAEPTEVGSMALADAGRKEVKVDLIALAPDNEPLPDSFALNYLHFPEGLPDFESPPEPRSQFDIPHMSFWQDNRHFWREYAEYIRVRDGLIQIQFVLRNVSETQLSNAKLEVTVEPLDGQDFQMIADDELPEEPKSRWDVTLGTHHRFPNIVSPNSGLLIDNGGETPVCHVRFGSLMAGEEGRSDKLALVPLGPGKLRLRFRIFGVELTAPLESEHVVETTGTVASLDLEGFKALMRKRFEKEERS